MSSIHQKVNEKIDRNSDIFKSVKHKKTKVPLLKICK